MDNIQNSINQSAAIGDLGFVNQTGAGLSRGRILKADRLPPMTGAKGSHRIAFAGLFLFTLLLYLRPNELFPDALGTFPITKIVAAIAVFAYLASKLGSGDALTIKPFELKLLGGIALLALAFTPLAAAPMDSIDMLLDMFIKVIIIFILMINVVRTRSRLRLMMSLVVVCGTIFAALAIKSYLVGDFTVIEKMNVGVVGLRITGAVGGFFGNPNDLATSLNMLLPLAVVLALTNRGSKRVFYFLCSAILTAGVVVTFSRGGFLGLLTLGAVLMWKAGRQNRVVTAMAFAVMLGVMILAAPGGYAGRITSMFNIGEDPTGSSQARRDLLERAASVAIHHPIIGIGMGNFHIYSIHEQVAHNSYLEIAAELGLAGLGLYLLLIFAPLRSLRKIEDETAIANSRASSRVRDPKERETHYMSIALQGVLFAYIVCSFFGSIQYQWFLYYPVAYAIALRRIHGADPASNAQPSVKTSGVLKRTVPTSKGVIWQERQRVGAGTLTPRSK